MRTPARKPPIGPKQPDARPPEGGSFVRRQVAYLLTHLTWPIIILSIASVGAGIAEAGILAIIAQTALRLANHAAHLDIALGSLRLHLSVDELLVLGLALTVLRLGLGVLLAFIPAWISDTTQARLRSELFAAFSRASWDVQSRDREGHLQELLTNHVGQATQASAVAASLITSSLTFAVLVLTAVAVSPIAAVGIIVVVGGLTIVFKPLARIGHQRTAALSQGWLAYANGTNEAVRLAEEAHVFGVEHQQRQQLDDLVTAFRRPNLHAAWLANVVASIYQGFIYLVMLLALLALSFAGSGHLASLGVVVLVLVRSGSYGQQIQSATQGLHQFESYVSRVEDARRSYKASAPLSAREPLERVESVEFKAVSYSYRPEEEVLHDVNFVVSGGEAIGVVGPSGAGKSTLVQILLDLRRPTSGSYLVNGLAASTVRRDDWHQRFAYVPQEPRLLHASVADNIRFYRSIPDAAVERAARQAGIHDEIRAWPAGYDTIVGPRADAISGGQQQRLCLARALAADPAVLILDEPTSALDPLSEERIQESLRQLKGQLTMFVVAHRMSTLDICDRVMVITGGRLDAFGEPAELLDTNSYYRAATDIFAPASPPDDDQTPPSRPKSAIG